MARRGFFLLRDDGCKRVSSPGFVKKASRDLIERVLHETGLPPQYLELELTESLLLANGDLKLSVVLEL